MTEGSLDNIGGLDGVPSARNKPRGAWSLSNVGTGGAQATATKASAGASLKNVITGMTFSFVEGGAVTAEKMTFVVRDGLTGAGAVLWSIDVEAVAAAAINGGQLHFPGLWIEGTAATAMTVESNDPMDTDIIISVNAWGEVTG